MKNVKFYQLLHAREMNTTLLAQLAGTSRAHLTEVLNNKPGRGHVTRRKIFPWILPEEASALGWREQYEAWLKGPTLRRSQAAATDLQAGAAMRSEENSEDTDGKGEGNTRQPVST